MMLQALLFDLDGTLADTERLGHRPAYNWAFKQLGLPFRWSEDLYRELLRQPGGRERVQHYLEHYAPALGEHADDVRRDPERWARKVHAMKARYFRNLLRRGRMPLRPGVSRLIGEAMQRGVAVAIVTNASRATLEPVLHYVLGPRLMDGVTQMVCGEDVRSKKPAPDLYELALERLGADAARCVAIEDSAAGLRAARAAGLPVVITTNDNTQNERFDDAVLVVSHLGDPSHPSRVVAGGLAGDCVRLATLQDIVEHAPTRIASSG